MCIPEVNGIKTVKSVNECKWQGLLGDQLKAMSSAASVTDIWNSLPSDSSVGRISEWEGLKSKAPRGWGVGRGCPPFHWGRGLERGCAPSPEKFCIFYIKITRLWCTLTPFWSNFIIGWKWTTMHKMVHFAMLQTTKNCSWIQDAFYHASNQLLM